MKKFIIWTSFILIGLGVIISIYFFRSLYNEFQFWGDAKIKMSETGQVGDFIGGIVGTLFALSGTFLIYLSFREQTNQNKLESFESSFFEMLRLHRENVSELKYAKHGIDGGEMAENRKVFRLIYGEFFECFREVNKFYRNTDDYLIISYETKLKAIVNRINPKINLKEMVMIDIAYSIVFFGVGDEGLQVLKNRFKKRYVETHILQLFTYLRLKSRNSEHSQYKNWQYFKALPITDMRLKIKELYDFNRKSPITNPTLTKSELDQLSKCEFVKYYGGHQFRLGHYFRHLFQTYKYLHYHNNLNKGEKYFYAKTLRAQLSTYEQALLFINSLSTLGMNWEFTPELKGGLKLKGEKLLKKQEENHLITIYQLIKNLPGEKSFGLKYLTYYPKVKYESVDV